MSPSHPCTKVAWIILYIEHRVEDICFKYFYWYTKYAGVFLNKAAVHRTVSRIHNKKPKLKIKLIMSFQFLKKFCKKHRILTAGNTNGYPVSRLDKFIFYYCPCKPAPYGPCKLFAYALLYLPTTVASVDAFVQPF